MKGGTGGTILFTFVEEVGLGRAQVDNLWTAVTLHMANTHAASNQGATVGANLKFPPRQREEVLEREHFARKAPHIFLLLCAFLAVVGVGDAWPAANDAPPLV